MKIYPAIDLLNGQSVRLVRGDYGQATQVAADPVAQAQAYAASGLTNLHLVDLDGAKAGRPVNGPTIAAIRAAFPGMIEVGGGIRTLAAIDEVLASGIDRVILGSIALKAPELVAQALRQFGPDKIVVGIDGANGRVATEGWLDQSDVAMADLMTQMVAVGVQTFIVTDIARDGTLTGPNVALLAQLQAQFPEVTVVASGGMAQPSDLTALATAGVTSAIVGKALAAGQITLADLVVAEGADAC